MRKIIYSIYKKSSLIRKLLNALLPNNKKLVKLRFQESFLEKYIYSFYDFKSLENRAFYNIGAGNQRSKFKFWTYVDLKDSKYLKNGVDLFYNLEELKPLPLENSSAELVFNSFVMEHISVEATKNLCKEAYRVLKDGGVFHSKVHSYDYAYRLLNNNVISPMIPFQNREALAVVDDMLDRNNGKLIAYFNEDKQYVIQSKKDKNDKCVFSAENTFLYHNATAAVDNFKGENEALNKMKGEDINEFYNKLKTYVDIDKKEPHQHNADYFSKEDLMTYLKGLGFSEVYFTEAYQSVSPALWEDALNPTHKGFLFAIEAVK